MPGTRPGMTEYLRRLRQVTAGLQKNYSERAIKTFMISLVPP